MVSEWKILISRKTVLFKYVNLSSNLFGSIFKFSYMLLIQVITIWEKKRNNHSEGTNLKSVIDSCN